MRIGYLTYTRSDLNRNPTGGEFYNEMVFGGLRRRPDMAWEEYCQDRIPAPLRSRWLSHAYYAWLFLFTSLDLVLVDAGYLGRCAFPLWLLRMRGKRIVLMLHHLNFHLKPGRISRGYDMLCCRLGFSASHRMICASEFSLAEILGVFRYRKPLLLIHPFLSFPAASVRPHAAPEAGKPVHCLCVGALEPRKNLRVLVELANRAPAHLDFRITVIGKQDAHPEYAAGLMQAVTRDDRIRFKGYVTSAELREEYGKSHLFLFPSKWEGFGMAVLEALAFGLPVLAYRSSSMPFLVDSGVNGMLVDPNDEDAFISEACALLGNPGKLEALRKNCGLPPKYAEGWEAKAERAAGFLFPEGKS